MKLFVINPRTNRSVRSDSSLGKRILAQVKAPTYVFLLSVGDNSKPWRQTFDKHYKWLIKTFRFGKAELNHTQSAHYTWTKHGAKFYVKTSDPSQFTFMLQRAELQSSSGSTTIPTLA
jgi:hypothetical protein